MNAITDVDAIVDLLEHNYKGAVAVTAVDLVNEDGGQTDTGTYVIAEA